MKTKILYALIYGLVSILIVGCDSLSESDDNVEINYLDESAQQSEQGTPILVAEPRPQSGRYAENFEGKETIAPLEIRTDSGSDYYVKVVNAANDNDTLVIYIRGGETIEVEVPLGSYEIRYASGDNWYGDKELFGSDTYFSKADTIFDFIDTGNQVSGYTITLYQVVNGNLQTKSIDKSQF